MNDYISNKRHQSNILDLIFVKLKFEIIIINLYNFIVNMNKMSDIRLKKYLKLINNFIIYKQNKNIGKNHTNKLLNIYNQELLNKYDYSFITHIHNSHFTSNSNQSRAYSIIIRKSNTDQLNSNKINRTMIVLHILIISFRFFSIVNQIRTIKKLKEFNSILLLLEYHHLYSSNKKNKPT